MTEFKLIFSGISPDACYKPGLLLIAVAEVSDFSSGRFSPTHHEGDFHLLRKNSPLPYDNFDSIRNLTIEVYLSGEKRFEKMERERCNKVRARDNSWLDFFFF